MKKRARPVILRRSTFPMSRFRCKASITSVTFLLLLFSLIWLLQSVASSVYCPPFLLRQQYKSLLSKVGELPSLDSEVQAEAGMDPCDVLLSAPDCNPQACFSSELLGRKVDYLFRPLQFSTSQDQCATPMGGQITPPSRALRGTISYVLTFQKPEIFVKRAILKIALDARYTEGAELIVVEDKSSDAGVSQVKSLLKVLHLALGFKSIYLSNKISKGFGSSNNVAAKYATGKFLAFVNSDASLQPGWSRTSLQTMLIYNRTGYLGTLLVGDQNLVTDGGGIVWADGRPEIIERGKNVLQPHLSYFRDVDYGSAVAVLVRKDVFDAVGGFDGKYGKSYLEDMDLCMKIRKSGFRVSFQPMSLAYHQEGKSLGDDSSEQKHKLMKEGSTVFIKSWQAVLDQKHCPQRDGYGEYHRHRKFNMLFIDVQLPEIDRDSGSIRQDYLLQLIQSMGVQIHYKSLESGNLKYVQRLKFLGVNVLDDKIEDILPPGGCRYHAVIVAHRDPFFEVIQALISSKCLEVTVFDTVDLHFLREMRLATEKKASWSFPSNITRSSIRMVEQFRESNDEHAIDRIDKMRKELMLLRVSRMSIFVSDVEIALVRKMIPNLQSIKISNLYDLSVRSWSSTPFRARKGCLFIGNMNHPPNQQAVHVLLEDIFPAYMRTFGHKNNDDVRLHIVGSNIIPAEIEELFAKQKDFVSIHRNLPYHQLKELYGSVLVALAPLLSGAGVKGKVAEAVLYGVPVIGTPIALESMYLRHDNEALYGNTSVDFAKQIHVLISNKDKWHSLREKAWAKLKDHFDLQHAKPAVEKVLRTVIPNFSIDNDPACA